MLLDTADRVTIRSVFSNPKSAIEGDLKTNNLSLPAGPLMFLRDSRDKSQFEGNDDAKSWSAVAAGTNMRQQRLHYNTIRTRNAGR